MMKMLVRNRFAIHEKIQNTPVYNSKSRSDEMDFNTITETFEKNN